MGEECSGLHMQKPSGYWANYMVHSSKAGILKEVRMDETFQRDNLVEFEMLFQKGDRVEAFTGSNGTLGTMILKFASQEEMLEKMDNMEKWVTVVVE